MNPRAEMCKIMHDYGEPLKLYNKKEFVNGAGIFDKILSSPVEQQKKTPYALGVKEDSTFSLWAYDYERIDKVDTVKSKGKLYKVLSGKYDPQMGCFRLVVKEE